MINNLDQNNLGALPLIFQRHGLIYFCAAAFFGRRGILYIYYMPPKWPNSWNCYCCLSESFCSYQFVFLMISDLKRADKKKSIWRTLTFTVKPMTWVLQKRWDQAPKLTFWSIFKWLVKWKNLPPMSVHLSRSCKTWYLFTLKILVLGKTLLDFKMITIQYRY